MNRVAIITGASRGLGRETALRFGRAGWKVVVNFSSGAKAAETLACDITSSGGEAFAFRADVSDYRQVEAMVEETISRFDRADLLVNNAGTARPGLVVKLSENDWNDMLDVNLKGAFNAVKAVSKTMMRQRSGHIINVSSILGVRGRAGQAAYCASKAGLIGLTKAIAVELAPGNIQVNAVLPGYMLTDMGSGASASYRDEALSENLLKRFSDPAEVAEFIYHLSGMTAVSGQVFNLDSRII